MIKTNEKEKWQKIEEKGYVDEKELQKMLADSPDLIPIEELGGNRKPIRVVVREAGLPGSGHTDLIGIDEDGNITIIETKLADNQEIKRKVIGQILEYAAYLWQKSYEEFDEIIHRKLNEYLLDRMQKEVKENDEWSAEEFRDTVETNLRNGTFTLFIVVDAINEELRRIIDYLKFKDFTNFSLCALELKNFREKGVAIVLPQLYGAASRSVSRSQINWTRESYIKFAEENIQNDWVLKVVEELYDFSFENFDKTYITPSKSIGRLRAVMSHPQATDGFVPLYQVKNTNHIKISFGGIKRQFPGARGEKYSKFLLDKFSNFPAIQEWHKITEKKYPSSEWKRWDSFIGTSMRIEKAIPDEKALAVFKTAFLDFQKEIQRDIENY